MNTFEYALLLAASGTLVGLVGSLTGLGGGFIVVPLLALAFGVDLRYAIGTSLVTVIATSSGSAAAFVRDGYTNIRIGMFLEVATTLGALVGGMLALQASKSVIGVLFGILVLYSASAQIRKIPAASPTAEPGRLARYFSLDGVYPQSDCHAFYVARRVVACLAVMMAAGALSALLGVGSGIVKVLALDRLMGLPFKVSAGTSNFMIGVTAAASAGLYFRRGYIDPGLTIPMMLGVLGGSFVGARCLPGVRTAQLRRLFTMISIAVGAEMIYNGVAGKL